MEVVRKYIDADSLMSVIRLPEKFRNRKLEVIILPAEEQEKSSKNAVDIDQALQSLVGAIPYTDMSLEELREERLKRMVKKLMKKLLTVVSVASVVTGPL